MEVLVAALLLALIGIWVSVTNVKQRLERLERTLPGLEHEERVRARELDDRLGRLEQAVGVGAGPTPRSEGVGRHPESRPGAAPVAPPPPPSPPETAPPTTPAVVPAVPAAAEPPRPPAASDPVPPTPAAAPRPASPVRPPERAIPPPPPPPPAAGAEPAGSPPPAGPGFDWEGLVGVKLFSAIAGIALVIAAIYFLRFSIEQGWLQPPVRFAIGVITALGLLAVCEVKAARRYPLTANAMDAAAIAILFATFFAGHALWQLISMPVAFVLLGLVTAVAVLLSVRRDSLFIAVLGLVGGFATPALLSSGENRPIALFSYLLLLNIGLAWIAHLKRWVSLAWLSLGFTALYQWSWVFRFLDVSSLPLGMGIFVVFALAGVGHLMFARRGVVTDSARLDGSFERSALTAAVLPALFAIYLATVPAYGARPGLLFGFLLLVDLGLLAVAIARREERLHATGAVATLLAVATWMAVSYPPGDWVPVAIFTAVFVALLLAAPIVARRMNRPFTGAGRRSLMAAPALLFLFPVLMRVEPAAAEPAMLFALLAGLEILVAWRAIAERQGAAYYTAAFSAVAAQAVWSAQFLTLERLGTAFAIYTIFGLIALSVPVAARRAGRPLEPAWGGGAVLLSSLALLLFLSLGPVAPAALWALALLLAILNAALFVESAGGGLPAVAKAGSAVSWLVLLAWWARTAGAVGVLPSLTALTGLSIVTLAGHGWVARRRPAGEQSWTNGLYLALVGHLFLIALAVNRAWAIPPHPLFGALVVITLATSAASLYARAGALHVAGVSAAALAVAVWAFNAGAPPYGLVAVIAAVVVTAYALGWIRLAAGTQLAARAAVVAAVIGIVSPIVATAGGARPPFVPVVLAGIAHVAVLLALAWRWRWHALAVVAVGPAWLTVATWQMSDTPSATGAVQLMVLTGGLFATFVAYPLILGQRAASAREPYVAAVMASVMCFFGFRQAFVLGGFEYLIGIIPVGVGGVLAVLFRALLRIEPPGARDIGRLALVAGAVLAFVTVAIPLQLDRQWITIGWALQGAALAWLYGRIPHKGLLGTSAALLAVVFVRLALNPEVLVYEPRGELRILNWYLYTYLVCAVAMLAAGRWLAGSEDRLPGGLPGPSRWLPGAAVVLLFLLVNIEIADYFATGPQLMMRFGVTLSQDLTYTIAWLVFGLALLSAGIWTGSRPGRVAAVVLIAVTTFKCFLYDLRSLEGLYRVASFVGLAVSLALVALALQKYVLSRPRSTT